MASGPQQQCWAVVHSLRTTFSSSSSHIQTAESDSRPSSEKINLTIFGSSNWFCFRSSSYQPGAEPTINCGLVSAAIIFLGLQILVLVPHINTMWNLVLGPVLLKTNSQFQFLFLKLVLVQIQFLLTITGSPYLPKLVSAQHQSIKYSHFEECLHVSHVLSVFK